MSRMDVSMIRRMERFDKCTAQQTDVKERMPIKRLNFFYSQQVILAFDKSRTYGRFECLLSIDSRSRKVLQAMIDDSIDTRLL